MGVFEKGDSTSTVDSHQRNDDQPWDSTTILHGDTVPLRLLSKNGG